MISFKHNGFESYKSPLMKNDTTTIRHTPNKRCLLMACQGNITRDSITREH